MNNRQAKMIAQYKELAEKSTQEVTVEVREHEGYDFDYVKIKAEAPKNMTTVTNTKILEKGEHGGNRIAYHL